MCGSSRVVLSNSSEQSQWRTARCHRVVDGGERYTAMSVQRDGEEAPRSVAVEDSLLRVVDANQRDGGEQYYTFQLRLDTYRRWPTWAGAKVEDLAREGFYYLGIRDEVRCFRCGQLLRLWRPGENIRERHRRYSPNCPFLASAEATHPGRMSPSGSFQPRHMSTLYSQTARPSDDMRFEEKRLQTYRGFPASCSVQPAELASAGFYFTGRDDGVQCFSCHIALRGWERGDTAEGEHRRHNPLCPFLNGNDSTNIPIQGFVPPSASAQTSQIQTSPALRFEHNRLGTFDSWPGVDFVSSEDLAEAGFFYVGEREAVRCFHCLVQIEQWLPGDVPVDEHIKYSPDCSYARAVAQRKQQYESYATPNAQATAERMKTYEQRMLSFRDWSPTAAVSAESLARAGFYYSGSGDGVRCFSCGGALRGWQQGDTAWGEHEKYFPSCDFVQQQRPAVSQSHDEPWRQPSTAEEPTDWPRNETSVNISDFIQQATSMGFPMKLARRVMEQRDTSILDFATYLDALLEAQHQAEEASITTTSHASSGSSVSGLDANAVSPATHTMLEPTAPPETEGVRRELERIQESRLCKICMEQEAIILFLPCAHILCCEGCSRNIPECPVCRTRIQNKVRSYFA